MILTYDVRINMLVEHDVVYEVAAHLAALLKQTARKRI